MCPRQLQKHRGFATDLHYNFVISCLYYGHLKAIRPDAAASFWSVLFHVSETLGSLRPRLVCICIYVSYLSVFLFNDTIYSRDYTTSNGMMISE
jgi:hypothetical protein